MQFTTLTALFVLLAPLASAHTFITKVAGANGKNGVGFGSGGKNMKAGHNAFYQAPRWLKSMPQYGICGVNRRNGNTQSFGIDWQADLATAVKNGLPTTSGDSITLTLYQLNKDGAGAYSCEVSADAKGKKWQKMTVTQNIPGNARGESNQVNRDHILKTKLPKGLNCTGPGGACLVRCKNVNINSFGGCFAIKRGGSSKRDVHGRRSIDSSEDEEPLMD